MKQINEDFIGWFKKEIIPNPNQKANNMLRAQMHKEVRALHKARIGEGCKFDKKILRFNDIVEAAIRYGRCASPFSPEVAFSALGECLDSAIIGNAMYVSNSSALNIVPDWMIVSEAPHSEQANLRAE